MPGRASGARTTIWWVAAALAVGFLAGRLWIGGPAPAATSAQGAAPEATATREAELAELDDLRTRAAQTPEPAVCTPAATATPEPTPTPVPPVAAGQPLPYGEDWIVTATGIALMPTISTETATGIFAQVNLTITNNASETRRFRLIDLRLVDDRGRVFEAVSVATAIVGGSGGEPRIPPSLPTETAVVFDVTTDVGSSFILESKVDPMFRVQLERAQLG